MNSPSSAAGMLASPESFRDAAGHFATGVTVITTVGGGVPAGTTASAVSSLSLDPPMMLVCLNRSSATHEKVASSGVFGVNILARDQGDAAYAFARKGADKFAGVEWHPAANGVPLIGGSLATMACRVVETAEGGTHTVFMGEVIEASTSPGEPLTYYRGGFGRFELDAEREAYASLREWILRRDTPVGAALDPSALATVLRNRPEHLHTALVRLESEGLVDRGANGAFLVAPMTSVKAHGAFAAQAAIESGVIDTCLAQARDEQLAPMHQAREELTAMTGETLEDRLRAIRNVHLALMSLSSSRQLLEAFEELSTGALWHHALEPNAAERMLAHHHLLEVADAVVARDLEGARSALARQLELVSTIADEAIAARGGTI